MDFSNLGNIGGFSDISSMLGQLKGVGEKIDSLAESTGITELSDLKNKYLGKLENIVGDDNDEDMSNMSEEFTQDSDNVMQAMEQNIDDPQKLEEAKTEFGGYADTIVNIIKMVAQAKGFM